MHVSKHMNKIRRHVISLFPHNLISSHEELMLMKSCGFASLQELDANQPERIMYFALPCGKWKSMRRSGWFAWVLPYMKSSCRWRYADLYPCKNSMQINLSVSCTLHFRVESESASWHWGWFAWVLPYMKSSCRWRAAELLPHESSIVSTMVQRWSYTPPNAKDLQSVITLITCWLQASIPHNIP